MEKAGSKGGVARRAPRQLRGGAVEWVYCDGRYQVTALVYGKDEPVPDRLAFIWGALEDKLGRKTTFNVRYVAYDRLRAK